jgi:hypothetical protein
MSYAAAQGLQAALFGLMAADPVLVALVDGIHDAPPPGTPQGTRVLLGEEEVLERGDATGPGAEHRVLVSVVSDAAGFAAAKAAAARLTDLLTGATLAVPGARVVAIWFQDARARRLDGGRARRIDLRFRMRLEFIAA